MRRPIASVHALGLEIERRTFRNEEPPAHQFAVLKRLELSLPDTSLRTVQRPGHRRVFPRIGGALVVTHDRTLPRSLRQTPLNVCVRTLNR